LTVSYLPDSFSENYDESYQSKFEGVVFELFNFVYPKDNIGPWKWVWRYGGSMGAMVTHTVFEPHRIWYAKLVSVIPRHAAIFYMMITIRAYIM